MSKVDVQSMLPVRASAPADDADRVDLRGLMRGIMRRKLLIAGLAVGAAVAFYLLGLVLPPTYSASSKVMLNPRNVSVIPSEEVVSNLDLSEPVILSEISVMWSNILLGDLVDHLGLERLEASFDITPRPEATRDSRMATVIYHLRENLAVQREGESYVVQIRFKSGDQALVAEVANGIAQTYIAMQLDERRASVREATAWIREQVAEAEAEVERTEAIVARYRAQSLEREGSSYGTANQQLANLTGQLANARAERVAAEAEYDQLRGILAQQGAQGLARAVTSPLLESMAEDRMALLREDDQWAGAFGRDHPRRVRLADEIARLDKALAEEGTRVIELYANAVEVARLREASLSEGIKDLEDRLAGISENTLNLRQREREAQAARVNYETLLSRLREATGQDKLQRPDARIIERATLPEEPAAPRPKLMGAFGGLLGLTLAIGAAVVMEMTRSTFRSGRELEAETGLRTLSSLPKVPGETTREIVTGLTWNPYTVFGERIRQLRTFLFMHNGSLQNRVILLTSSRPGEGKSLTALALAEMAARAGKSVIFIDADLRRSRLMETFGWTPEHDLSDFILERCDLVEAIHRDADLGIDLLAARHSPEAADELSVSWLRPMVEELKRVYDIVIIDSPPILEVADGLVLGRVADSILYVVAWDSTPRAAVAEGLDAFAVMRLGVTGVVLNQVDPAQTDIPYGESYAAYTKQLRAARG